MDCEENRTGCSGIEAQPEASSNCEWVCGDEGCGYFDSASRDRFWPHFSHPRWLSLECLYNQHSSCNCDEP